jgi:hypothetical protein
MTLFPEVVEKPLFEMFEMPEAAYKPCSGASS